MAIVLDGTGSITGLTSGAGIAAAALSGQVPDANAPSGSVIQVVQAVSSTTTNTTSTSFSNAAGMTASITPTNAGNKILVLIDVNVRGQASDSIVGGLRILRDGATAVYTDDYVYNVGVNANVGVAVRMPFNYLDSPNTTSTTTYDLQLRRVSSAGISYNFSVNPSASSRSTITLMEIAA